MGNGDYAKSDGNIAYADEANGYAGILQLTTGENITANNVVYVNTSDGKVYVADLATAGDRRVSGIALETITTGNTITIQTNGAVENLTGLTAGSLYYLGNSGALTTTANNNLVGIAKSTTSILLMLSGALGSSSSDTPIGAIMPWAKSLTGVPSLPSGWVECNGATLSDAESPLNGQVIPNLNGSNYFLRGNSTSGTTGGSASASHNHQTTQGNVVGSVYPNTDTNGYGARGSYDSVGAERALPASSAVDYTANASIDNQPPYFNVVYIMKVK